MENLLDAIRVALAADATDDVKSAGASACRTILAALDSKAGEPLAVPEVNPIASAVAMLRAVPAEQLLDLAIGRLRAALPAGTTAAPVPPMQFKLVPVPPLGKRS